jgi:FimV-like protein
LHFGFWRAATEADKTVKARYWGWVLLTAFWFPTGAAWSLGLGDLTVRSPLDAPLVAEINLLAVSPSEIDDLWVGLSSDSDFRQAGIEREGVLNQIVFSPSIRNDGSTMVEVSSQIPISEPYLHFLVTLKWTGGQIVREYTLLLYRPMHDGTTPATIIGPEIPAAELIAHFGAVEASRGVPSSHIKTGRSYGPIQRLEYLIGIGNRLDLSRDISIYQRLYAILTDNPHAFIHGNMNLLRAGVVLDIPTGKQMAAVSRVLAMETFIRQVAEWQEYRLKIGVSSDGDAVSDQERPEMAVMKATMIELEEEIVRLRQQLEEAIVQATQSVEKTTNAAEYREQLGRDIRRLEAARDQLVQTIDKLSDPPEIAFPMEADGSGPLIGQSENAVGIETSILSPVETAADSKSAIQKAEATRQVTADGKQDVAVQEKLSEMETMHLFRNLENQKLQEQVLLLEKQVQKAVTLLGVKDEALALAQQEAAVYGAALEALESTSNEYGGSIKQEDVDLDSEKVEASSNEVTDNLEPVVAQEEKIVDSVVNSISDKSNRPVLLLIGAALLLLLLSLAIRRKRFQGKRNRTSQTLSAIETTPMVTRFTDDSGVASKLDLARAYVDMGDHEAARALLSEVRAEGDPDQKAESERLSDLLSS